MPHKKRTPLLFIVAITLLFTQTLSAKSAHDIDTAVDVAIEAFKQEVSGGEDFLPKIKGYLVFPRVIKAAVIIGGKYGKGALRINGETQHYYDMSAASIGFQAGAQEYSMLIAFISDAALNNFIRSNGWEAGLDGSITVSEWGQNIDLSSISFEKPIMAFIYGAKGLMASVSVTGTKFRRITP
ncbi:MAG: YSC84-related protein [Sulfurovum sp.]|nr:YSC84-related protein [Sulfurovum sp.]